MRLSTLREELERMALFYGDHAEILFHGPDGHVDGAYGVALRVRALTITSTDESKMQVVIFEGAGEDGSVESGGHFELALRNATKIENGRGARGPLGDYPPGS